MEVRGKHSRGLRSDEYVEKHWTRLQMKKTTIHYNVAGVIEKIYAE